MRTEMRSDTELVLAAREDDPAAFGELFDRWFDRAWNVARNIVRDDDLAADVAQDALLGAWQRLDQLRDADAFGGWLLRSTRNRALNKLSREKRSTTSGDEVVSGLRDRGQDDPAGAEPLPEPDLVSEIRDRQELVWAAASALGERDASLLDLHLRHGLTPAELADELGVAANAAHQQLFKLRNRLGDAIGAYLLWRNGRPLCDGLAEAVSGHKAFDRAVARRVRRHQTSCEACTEQRAALVDPSKLFASVPLLVVPVGLKAQAAAALTEAGVPIGGSSAGGLDGPTEPQGPADPEPSIDGGQGDGPSTTTEPETPTGSEAPAGSEPPTGSEPSADGPPGGDETPAGVQEMVTKTVEHTFEELTDPTAGPGHQPAGRLANGRPAPIASRLASMPLRRERRLALIGVGVTLVALLLGFGAFALREGRGPTLAAIDSGPLDPPNAGQEGASGSGDNSDTGNFTATVGNRDEGAPGGPSLADDPDDPDPETSVTTTTLADTTTSESTTTTTVETTTTTEPSTTTTESTTTTTLTTTSETTTPTTPSTSETTRPTTPTTPSTSETTLPPPPEILRFISASSTIITCQTRTQLPFRVLWATQDATSVTLHLPDGTALRDEPNGSHHFCAAPGDTVTLVAHGLGGKVDASLVL